MSKHTVLEPPYKGNNYDMQNFNLYSSLKMPDLIIHNNLLMNANKPIKSNGLLSTFHNY